MCTSTEVHGVHGSGRFLFCTHWLNPLELYEARTYEDQDIITVDSVLKVR